MKRTVFYGSLAIVLGTATGLWLAVHTPSDKHQRSITVIGRESAPPNTETTSTESSNEPSQQYDDGSWSWIVEGQSSIDSHIEKLQPFARQEFRITPMEDRLIPKSWHDRVIVLGGPHNPNSLAHKSPTITPSNDRYPIDEYIIEFVDPNAAISPSTPPDR